MSRELVVVGKLKGKSKGTIEVRESFLLDPTLHQRNTNSILNLTDPASIVEITSEYDVMKGSHLISWGRR